jgi:acyl-CoA thioesterase-2
VSDPRGSDPLATSRTFLDAIALTEVAPASGSAAAVAFEAIPQYVPWPKAFGGDLVAQAALSAIRSTEPTSILHSMHSYFLLPVDVAVPVRYEVEELRNGRSFSTRQVRAFQNDALAFTALASFAVAEDGPDFAEDAPTGIPSPESLPSSAQVLAGVDSDAARYWSSGRSFDMRHVPGPIYLEVDGGREPHQAVWIKAFDALPDDPSVHVAALAYVCDYTILEPVLRQQGRAWADDGLMTASLDHSLWLHRPGRMDEWVLYAQHAASASNNRGLARGSFYTRDGVLLATVAQEGMIRTRRPR